MSTRPVVISIWFLLSYSCFLLLQVKTFKLNVLMQADTSFSTQEKSEADMESAEFSGTLAVFLMSLCVLIWCPRAAIPLLQDVFHICTGKYDRDLYVLLALKIPKI